MRPSGETTTAARPEGPGAGPIPGAVWALCVLTVLNFLNYVDRYVLPAVLHPLRMDPAFAGHSDAQFGLLQFGFLITYMVFSPIGGALGARVARKYIVAGGVGIWSVATVWSGLARSYPELMAARALIGFGEAGYAAVAPAIISDLFSPDRRARMLSVFYTATPAGSALGFMVGGLVAEHWGWRRSFWVAGVPGLIFALLALTTVEPRRGTQDAPGSPAASTLGVWSGLRTIVSSRRWLFVTAGFTLMTFTTGGLGFWAPNYFQEVRGLSEGQAGLWFGGITTLAGVIGTVAGGFLGDAWARRDEGGYMLLSGLGLLVAVPFTGIAFYAPGLGLSLGLVFLGELFLFLNTGPLNAALIASTEPRLRELSVGLNILCLHLLGDLFSPTLMGATSDLLVRRGHTTGAAHTFALSATAGPLVLGGILLCVGARYFRTSAKSTVA
jgi:MFS family permease